MLRISIKKQRNLSMSKIKLKGENVSVNNSPEVYFESSLESDYMYLLEFNPEVKFYYERPIILSYKKVASTNKYTPNFLVDYHSGRKELVELKHKSDLALPMHDYAQQFELAQQLCKENNLTFRLLSEEDIHTPQLFNAKFLTYYQNPTIRVNDADVDYLLLLVKKYKKVSVKQLLSIASKDEYKQAELLYTLWYTVASYLISYNKDEELTMDTVLFL